MTTTLRIRVLTLILILAAPAAGCANDEDDPTAPDHDAGSQTDAAHASDNGGCPEQAPEAGADCTGEQRCDYETMNTAAGCIASLRLDAVCESGTWQLWHPVTCRPLRQPERCDPRGSWSLQFEYDDERAASCLPSDELVVREVEGGVLQVRNKTGQISPDGCRIGVEWSTRWSNSVESGGAQYQVGLELMDDLATGTVRYSSRGACGGEHEGTASGERAR